MRILSGISSSSELEIYKCLDLTGIEEHQKSDTGIKRITDRRTAEHPVVRELKHMCPVALQILHNHQQQDSHKSIDTSQTEVEIIKSSQEHTRHKVPSLRNGLCTEDHPAHNYQQERHKHPTHIFYSRQPLPPFPLLSRRGQGWSDHPIFSIYM